MLPSQQHHVRAPNSRVHEQRQRQPCLAANGVMLLKPAHLLRLPAVPALALLYLLQVARWVGGEVVLLERPLEDGPDGLYPVARSAWQIVGCLAITQDPECVGGELLEPHRPERRGGARLDRLIPCALQHAPAHALLAPAKCLEGGRLGVLDAQPTPCASHWAARGGGRLVLSQQPRILGMKLGRVPAGLDSDLPASPVALEIAAAVPVLPHVLDAHALLPHRANSSFGASLSGRASNARSSAWRSHTNLRLITLGEGARPSCTCLLYTSPSPRDRQKSRM